MGFELVGEHTCVRGEFDAFRADGQRRGVADFPRRDQKRPDRGIADPHLAEPAFDALDGSLQPVVLADEPRHETPHRLFVQLFRRGHLLQRAVVEHRHPVGEHHRFLLVVRDIDEGDPERPLDAADLVLHLLPQPPVEGAERFVHEHQVRLEHQCAGDGHPLLLPAGELPGLAVLETLQPHQLERPVHLLPPPGRIHFPHFERERQVLSYREMREQGVVLEHHPDPALPGRGIGDFLPPQADRTAGRDFEAGQHHQAGGLPAAGRPEQRQELSLLHLEVETVHDEDFPVVGFGDAPEFDIGRVRRRALGRPFLLGIVHCVPRGFTHPPS